jgi:hypothetical protein
MGTGIISELVVYKIGVIKKASVQTPTQLVGRHVYTWDPHRKKILVEGRDIPLIPKREGVLDDPHFALSCRSGRRWRWRLLRGIVRGGKRRCKRGNRHWWA